MVIEKENRLSITDQKFTHKTQMRQFIGLGLSKWAGLDTDYSVHSVSVYLVYTVYNLLL